jgi:capsid protein/prohead serine protease
VTDHDFGGYATKVGVKCTDGRTITSDAFKHMDGQEIPLVWQHMHDSPDNILGHAKLEHRANDGTYAYCYFNKSKAAQSTQELVQHGDVKSLSIYANGLVEKNKTVLHGELCEVSVVLKGANKGAKIDYVKVAHSSGDVETLEDEAVITFGLELEHADGSPMTYQDVYDTLDEDQKSLVEFMVKQALESGSAQHSVEGEKPAETNKDDKESEEETESDGDDKKEDGADDDEALEHKENDTMTRNVFENNKDGKGSGDEARKGTLTHSQIQTLVDDGKRLGSFKEAVLQHAEDYGITNIEILFPDARAIDDKPEWITRRIEWVEGVLNATRKLPFSKIKSLSADLTHEEARAKGYIKAEMKKEQFFTIAKRETGPKTIYKKQKLDRDDIIDITDFDVVAWIWVEMNFMLREEIARAIMVGDGREIDDPDKIDETKIRPIAFDDPFYTDVVTVAANIGGNDLVEAVLRARHQYKGTNPTAYMTTQVMMDMLLAKDSLKRRYWNSKAELASALAVNAIVEVPVMEDVQRDGAEVLMLLVNLSDYAVGSTRGGEITRFDDFDIDFNQYKYLIEGRMSGALTQHKRAQVVLRGAGTLATPTVPTFNSGTGVITIPTVTGVTYKTQDSGPLGTAGTTLAAGAQTALTAGQSQSVVATPNTGYYFPHNFDADWTFTRPA